MGYLKHKPGSIEEIVANQTSKFREDSGYQKMFKKELDKAGKGIGSMSPAEKDPTKIDQLEEVEITSDVLYNINHNLIKAHNLHLSKEKRSRKKRS